MRNYRKQYLQNAIRVCFGLAMIVGYPLYYVLKGEANEDEAFRYFVMIGVLSIGIAIGVITEKLRSK
jgi:hypothetical protein